MAQSKGDSVVEALPPIDRLLSRPDADPLPTALDPAGKTAHGYPADPKPQPHEKADGKRDDGSKPDDIGRTA